MTCFTGLFGSAPADELVKLSLPPPPPPPGSWCARRAAFYAHLAPVKQGAAVFTRLKVCWCFHSDLSGTVVELIRSQGRGFEADTEEISLVSIGL